MASRPLVCGVFIGFFALSSIARAEPSAADKETARRLMAEGRDKRGQNDHKGALQSFMAADAIMHVPTTGLEVAREEASLGQLLEARDTALRVARSTPEPDDPAPFTRAREEAQKLSDDLAKRIPVVTLSVAGAEPNTKVDVAVDGAPIPPAAAGAPRTVNPGHHVAVASAGKKEAKVEFDVAEAEQKQVALELKAKEASPAPPPAKVQASTSHVGKPLMIGGFAAGTLGLIVGSVAGIISISKTSSIKNNCAGKVCPPSETANIDSAKSAATISNIGFGFAIVGAGVGVLGYFLWKGEQARDANAPAAFGVGPWIGLGSGGVRGVF